MSNLLGFFLIKLFEPGPLVALVVGLSNPRWALGVLASIGLALISTALIYSSGPMELAAPEYQMMFGTIACLLTFAIGKGARLLVRPRSRQR